MKSLEYMNAYTMLSLSEIIGNFHNKSQAFNILDNIEYLLNLNSINAIKKKIVFTFTTEACFPKEVSGKKQEFELILATLIEYLIKNMSDTELKVFAKLKNALEGKFILTFDLMFKQNEILTYKSLQKIFTSNSSLLEIWKDSRFNMNQILKIIK